MLARLHGHSCGRVQSSPEAAQAAPSSCGLVLACRCCRAFCPRMLSLCLPASALPLPTRAPSPSPPSQSERSGVLECAPSNFRRTTLLACTALSIPPATTLYQLTTYSHTSIISPAADAVISAAETEKRVHLRVDPSRRRRSSGRRERQCKRAATRPPSAAAPSLLTHDFDPHLTITTTARANAPEQQIHN